MARSERQVPSVYFGRPGSLVTMPWPRGDLDKPYERPAFDFVTGSGQHAVSMLAQGARAPVVSWNALHIDTFTAITQYWIGANGVGPWAFIDPSMPNLLLPNQSAATGVLNDTSNFGTSTGAADMGVLSSNSAAAQIHRTGGRRSLRWQFLVTAATTPVLRFLPPYRNWFGIPAMVGLPYTWSLWTKPDGVVDSNVSLSANIEWLDSAGATLSTTVGGVTAVTAWQRLTATGTAPANTAYMRPILSMTGSTMTTNGSVYVDEPLLEQDSIANNWAPGTGLRAVEILSLTDTVPFEARMRRNLNMTLRELAI